MLSPFGMQIFYSACGVTVAYLLFRIWRKNRVSQPPKQLASTPWSTDSYAVAPQPAAIDQTRASVTPPPVPAATQPWQPKPSATVFSNQIDAVARPAAAASSVKAASVAPVFGAAVSRSEKAHTHGASSWEGRRLLESTGTMPREINALPRVLPEDIPGIDDRDRIFGSWLNPAFASLLPESDEKRDDVRKDLMAAGFYNPHAIENLAATRYALMILGVVIFGSMLLLVPPRLEPWMVAGCILAPLLGWALPTLYIRGKAKERKQEIERAMPDLLDMLNMCVSQGLTVPASLERVGRDFRSVYPALSQELEIVNQQSRIGTMHTALENFSRRIDIPEVHSLTSLLIQTERMGTSISQALTTYSDTMRESQRQQADEKGNRATFRLLFPTVLCLMPAVYLFLLGPAVNELQRFFYGGGINSINNGSQVVQRFNSGRNQTRTPNRINNRIDQAQ